MQDEELSLGHQIVQNPQEQSMATPLADFPMEFDLGLEDAVNIIFFLELTPVIYQRI